eukprot:TRINITY_DN7798_c0_g1_i2.p1 TRINITY_DN7798_c0_g1~~TRINITY_DN7798_c0_g1_i2.p1  ORF type:complete len:203 (+),score=77.78 TRINITY_DN7798_c0_g1_i2:67-675(+)
MTTASGAANITGATKVGKDSHYERIVLEPSTSQVGEVEHAKDLLDLALCSIPEEEEYDDKEEFLNETKEAIERGKKNLPKKFPFTVHMSEDESVLDKQVFKDYTGDVYWNECGRDFIVDPDQPKENFKPENMANLVYRSLKPFRILEGGMKPLTVKSLCEGVADLGFETGGCNFLENVDVQLREIDGKEVMTIVFFCGFPDE